MSAIDEFLRLARKYPKGTPNREELLRGAVPVVEATSLVYYVRFCCRVKIGVTSNLEQRLASIPHHEVLATEPGGVALERQRHEEFALLRDTGEWFFYGAALREHIRKISGAVEKGGHVS